jgi:hypothetical protein
MRDMDLAWPEGWGCLVVCGSGAVQVAGILVGHGSGTGLGPGTA